MRFHTMLVVGGRDVEAGNISVRLHGKGNVGAKPKAEVIAEILQAIKTRQPYSIDLTWTRRGASLKACLHIGGLVGLPGGSFHQPKSILVFW